MGHKYLAAHLWDDSVACLRRAFPTDLKEMQETMAKDSKLITKGEDATCIRLADGDHLLHLVDVLVAVGLETVLPALYYRILWSTNVVRFFVFIRTVRSFIGNLYRTLL